MSQSTYIFLCGKLRPYIAKQVFDFSGKIQHLKNILLFCMQVTQLRLRSLSGSWQLTLNTERSQLYLVVATCHTIATHLLPQYVHIPQIDRLKEIVEGFEICWGFPQAAGAIDGSHNFFTYKYVLMRVHLITIIVRDTTLSS